MNTKNFFLSWLAVFITIFIVDMVIHGKILSDLYHQTANLWRPKNQMNAFMPWMMLGTVTLLNLILPRSLVHGLLGISLSTPSRARSLV